MSVLWWALLLGSASILAWVYLFYPAVVWLAGRGRARPAHPTIVTLPSVSVVLAVHNEAAVLERKIENCLALDYPPDRLETIIVSDGSTDGTDAILRRHVSRTIRILVPGERLGKTEAQNRAVACANHDIVFFTDATTTHPPDVLQRIVAPFVDPTVGCVSGRAVFRDDGSPIASGLALKQGYDHALRMMQSRVRTLFGATGCVYALRRDRYVPLRPDLVSDFVEPLKLLEAGYRTVHEPSAIGLVDRPSPDLHAEFARRSRMVLQGFRAVVHMRALLDVRRHPLQALAFLTQRPLKWLTPLFALGTLAGSIALRDQPAVRWLLLAQSVFYATALLTFLLDRVGLRLPRLLSVPLYFTVVSLGAFSGLVQALRGKSGRFWSTRHR